MAAPSGTTWGSIAGGYGRVGIYVGISNTNTQTTVTISTWFWSKYSVSDSSNNYYYNNNATSATSKVGSVNIKTTVASGEGWSTSNQVKLGESSYTYDRGTSAVTRNCAIKLTDVERVGATMTHTRSYTIPALASYTVSYNANGGSGAPSAQTKWYGKKLTLSSDQPQRTGYRFVGWALSKADGDEGTWYFAPGGVCEENRNFALYAAWVPNTYTVKYNANGGSGAPSSQTKTYGVTLKLSSTVPTRTNYNFLGWGTSASATKATYAAGANYTSNQAITLYAVWELAYVKPRITELSVSRCNSSGDLLEDGAYALVKFNWACDQAVTQILISWKSASGETGSITASASGTTGTVTQLVGTGQFATDVAYSFTITVTDNSGYSVAFGTLYGTAFTVDYRVGGSGVAFGKPAELEGVLDIAFKTRFLGGILSPVLEAETDLNDVRVPNTYTGENVANYHYANCPITSGTFTLRVESCGESGQVKQTCITCSKIKPEVYSRFYYQDEWGDWCWASTDEAVLYENSSGSSGDITLKYSAANYTYLEIFFTDNNNKTGGYTKVWKPDGKDVCLHIQEAGAKVYSRQTIYTISGTGMKPTITYSSYVYFNGTESAVSTYGTNYIKIQRVVGLA